jgi:hypothetical protein
MMTSLASLTLLTLCSLTLPLTVLLLLLLALALVALLLLLLTITAVAVSVSTAVTRLCTVARHISTGTYLKVSLQLCSAQYATICNSHTYCTVAYDRYFAVLRS